MQYHYHWNTAIQIEWHFNYKHLWVDNKIILLQTEVSTTAYLYLSYTEAVRLWYT